MESYQQGISRIIELSLIIFFVFIRCDYITDFTVPELSIIAPSDGDTLVSIGQLQIGIEIQANDNKVINHIDLFLNNNLVSSLTESPYRTNIIDTMSESHSLTLRAKAYDNGGNWKEASAQVFIRFYEPQLEEIGFYDTPGQCYEVMTLGNYTFLADGTEGFRIIDVSNPCEPIEIGHCNTPGEAYDLAISGNYAYIADGAQGFRIIDITNHANPYEVGSYDPPGYNDSYGICVEGNYAYLTNNSRGLCVIDITNPSNPTEIGRTETDLYKLTKIGNYIYAINSSCDIIAIYVGDPTQPYKTSVLPTSSQSAFWFRDIINFNNNLYTAVSDFLIIEPVTLTIKGTCKSYGDYSLAIKDSLAYITGNRFGKGTLSIVNIADSAEPSEIYWWNTPANEAYGITCYGEYLLVASGNAGLQILKVKLCP